MKQLLPAILLATLSFSPAAIADPISVNVDNFDRAQTDMEFDGIIKLAAASTRCTTTAHQRRSTSRTSSA